MTIIDQFKNFCRDKCKYNVESLDEMKKLYNEFEDKKRTGILDQDSTEEITLTEDNFSDLLNIKPN